jgi:hypothetical protein
MVTGDGFFFAGNRLTCDGKREREREREMGDFVVFWVCFVVKRERKVTDHREKEGA